MDLLKETRYVERQQFFNGQRLFADDLQTLEAFNREMRWLHNRSLHQPGIGSGLAVRGKKDDRKVTVEPGYAVDAEGREIVLLESQELDVPPVAGDKNGESAYYDLVVSYPDDAGLEVVETRAGVCAPRSAVRLREEPVFCWVRLARTESGGTPGIDPSNRIAVKESMAAQDARLGLDIENGMRIVVARAEVRHCKLYRDLSIAERRSARPAVGPYLGSGTYRPAPWPVYWWGMEDEIRALLADLFRDQMQEEPEPVILLRAARAPAFARAMFPAGLLSGRQLLLGALGPLILPLGLQATVPAGQACFRATPHYMARLGGEHLMELDLIALLQEQGLLDPAALNADTRKVLESVQDQLRWNLYWDGSISVLDPQPGSFVARLAVMVQLLELPDLDVLGELQNNEQLKKHLADRFGSSPVGRKLAECQNRTGPDREACILEAVELAMQWIEDVFRSLLARLEWQLVWMGVEA